MTAPAGPLAADLAGVGVPGPPARQERVQAVPVGAGHHGLGGPHAACRRVANAAVESLCDASVGWVPVGVLGAALVATVPGARFDPDDPDEVALVLRLVAMWPRRLLRLGADVQEVDVERRRVRMARAPVRGDDSPIEWAQVGSRVELARWARGAAAAQPGPPTGEGSAVDALAAALDPDPDRLALGREVAARVRADELAAGRPWPPPVPETAQGRVQSGTTHRPLVVHGELASLDGCVCRAGGVLRLVARAGGWRCPHCGAVTALAEQVGGPRLPVCECLGDGPVCVHVGARPAPARQWTGG